MAQTQPQAQHIRAENRGRHGKVTVIGCGRLGAPYAAALAEIGHDVLGVEVDAAALQRLQLGSAPFDEPGLDEAIAAHLATGQMRFINSYADAVAFADVHFVCVPTPQQQGGLAADLTTTEAAITVLAARPKIAHVIDPRGTLGADRWRPSTWRPANLATRLAYDGWYERCTSG